MGQCVSRGLLPPALCFMTHAIITTKCTACHNSLLKPGLHSHVSGVMDRPEPHNYMDIWWQKGVCSENGLQLGQLCLDHPQFRSSHQLVLLLLCPQKVPELIPWFHAPLLPLVAWQGSPTCTSSKKHLPGKLSLTKLP